MRWLVVTTLTLVACRDSKTPDSQAPTAPAPLRLEVVDVDAAAAPARGRPFIAGEPLRLELRVAGGTPPYEVDVVARAGGSEAAAETVAAAPADDGATAVTVVAQLRLEASAPSGPLELGFRARDAAGAKATAQAEHPLLGAGEEERAEGGAIAVLDAGQRRRSQLHRGESVSIEARLSADGEGPAKLTIEAPDGSPLQSGNVPVRDDGQVQVPIQIPPMAMPGDYTVELERGDEAVAGPLTVAGPPFPAAGKLSIDDLTLTGGEDQRSPRGADLERGEAITVEARVGGMGGDEVTGTVTLERGEDVVVNEPLSGGRAAAQHPTARMLIRGALVVAPSLEAGRYLLRVKVVAGADVSELYRELRVR